MLAARHSRLPQLLFNHLRRHFPIVHCRSSISNMTNESNQVVLKPSLISIDTDAYAAQLDAKQKKIELQFADLDTPDLEIFKSKPEHYRMRAEFTVWHDKGDSYYTMFQKDETTGESQRTRVDSFPVGSELINQLMTRIITAIRSSQILKHKLFQANFHTTLSGQSMITLIYHKKIDSEWETAAKELRKTLADTPGATSLPHIIGRSRKQKINIDEDEVEEILDIPGRGTLHYIQIEGAFSQPNAGICTSMVGWAVDVTTGSTDHDLLELYCGNGNFTAAVAPNFRNVIATEISKTAVAAARRNFVTNHVSNVFVARMSSEEFTEAWHSGRKYNRLESIDLKSYSFKTLLVDPPRAGLDDKTIKLLDEFERVVYISCNPDTLHRDVMLVKDQFEIERFAVFDQFPYTHHVECGVYLKRKEGIERKGSDDAAGERHVKQKMDDGDDGEK